MKPALVKSAFRNPAAAAVVAAAAFLSSVHPGRSQTVPVNFSGDGMTSFDGWVGMNSVNFPVSGVFPGAGNWTAPAESNAPDSGDAKLVRVSGGGGGGPFFAGASLYFGSFVQVANELGGTLRVSEPSPVPGVKTVTLQVQIGEALGYGFVSPGGSPVLKVNGTATGHQPSHAFIINRYQDGVFPSPDTGEEPVYVKTVGYQWDVAALGPVNSIEIEFSAVTHSQIYELRLDQTSAAQAGPVFIPEYFRLVQSGTPQFDGLRTTVSQSFQAPPSRLLTVGYSDNLDSFAQQSSGPLETGDGTVSATFTAEGDKRAAWTRQMFFRAGYPPAL